MIDRLFYKFFGWVDETIDKLFSKITVMPESVAKKKAKKSKPCNEDLFNGE